jgi:hypothetical protein
MGAGVPPVIQGAVWTIVASALFVFGGICLIVTASKTVESYKNSNDSWSASTIRHLVMGGAISALLLFGGIYGVVKLMGSVNQGFGLASSSQPAIDVREPFVDTADISAPASAQASLTPHTA